MCEICKCEGKDSRFLNGEKNYISTHNLYKVYKNSVAPIRLCYIHSLELFLIGESRFLKEHLSFARILAGRTKKTTPQADSMFGF